LTIITRIVAIAPAARRIVIQILCHPSLRTDLNGLVSLAITGHSARASYYAAASTTANVNRGRARQSYGTGTAAKSNARRRIGQLKLVIRIAAAAKKHQDCAGEKENEGVFHVHTRGMYKILYYQNDKVHFYTRISNGVAFL
jgi:hypothetical protein